MPMLEGLAIGDLHLDKLVKVLGEAANAIQIQHLDRAFQYAVNKSIPNVFLLGDVCDRSRLSYDALCRLLECLIKWDGKLNIHIILGNHDFDEIGVHSLQPLVTLYEKCDLFKSTHIYDKATQSTIDGVICNFLSYPHSTPIPSKKQPLNFGHFEVRGAMRDNGRIIQEALDVHHKHHYILGHLHTPHNVGRVHYTGTMYQLSWGEKLDKGVTHFKATTDGNKLSVKYMRVAMAPLFRLLNLIVDTESDLKQLTTDPNNLYKIFVSTGMNLPTNLLTEYKNIVKVEGYTSKVQLDALLSESLVAEDQDIPEVDTRRVLSAFLKHKGATKTQVQRALVLLNSLRDET